MKSITCKNCGATGLQARNGFWICEYCNSRFMITTEDYYSDTPGKSSGPSGITVSSDVEMLLQKCRMNPRNARKYANLILDIDPTNKEALKYL